MLSEGETQVGLQHFNQLSVIGKGSYAKVVLVKRKGDEEQVYAMKILKKKFIQQKKQERQVMIERDILISIDHPFLVKLYHSFQDQKKLYFILEYCPGGELFSLLSKKQKFSEEQAKFYSAQILLALEDLHKRDIVYRDLKPENVLIDIDGYLRLTDFGLSKMEANNTSFFSVCGTPEYLAPEILNKEGHGRPVDWWCLGSLIYEMTVGLPPFYSKNRGEIFDRIKHSPPVIPPKLSLDLRNLFEGLFQKKPANRLGSKKGAEEIKSQAWFQGVDWQGLLQKKHKAPFVPMVKSQLDVHYFGEFIHEDIESFSEASAQSSGGHNYSGFSFDKSNEERRIDSEDPLEEGEFSMDIKESMEIES